MIHSLKQEAIKVSQTVLYGIYVVMLNFILLHLMAMIRDNYLYYYA